LETDIDLELEDEELSEEDRKLLARYPKMRLCPHCGAPLRKILIEQGPLIHTDQYMIWAGTDELMYGWDDGWEIKIIDQEVKYTVLCGECIERLPDEFLDWLEIELDWNGWKETG
jgi:hypothetical protein